jgi:ABC-type bacteriocin/lantibiotic exporter with double-glycine peptidase domain
MADGLEDGKLTRGQWLAVGLVAVLNVVGRLTPFYIKIVVDQMKEGMQIEMGTNVIQKIFELPHDATISTPIGKFGQLIRAIYMNCDKLLPAVYGAIVPVALETLVAFALIAAFYGGIAVVQLFLFAAYTIMSYRFALRKSSRNGEMMNAMMDEYGNILATAGSYERAHVFGNTQYEVPAGADASPRRAPSVTSAGRPRAGLLLQHRQEND